jgi:hypothetical protein
MKLKELIVLMFFSALILVRGQDHSTMDHGKMKPSGKSPAKSIEKKTTHKKISGMPSDHKIMHHDGESEMTRMLGSYPMTREASGTSWQPESTPMSGVHTMEGDWMLMMHGFANLVFDHQGGRRGDDKIISENMLMGMAQHPLGEGTFGARGMFTLEPATVGKEGYPLLLQTGETADGIDPLTDRQHPHDFLMELALTYSHPIARESSIFAYFGMPGEPALGPSTFMHRFSGMDNPEAPITHHWLDSTHITFGVATLGYVWRNLKFDGSIFTGREPDQKRWNFDEPKFDSYSGRVTYHFTKNWSVQASYGALKSPEQLEPEVDTDRYTVSASYHHTWKQNNWQTTFAWGRNANNPGRILDGFLLESAVNFSKTHTVFGRAERVSKDELFHESDPLHNRVFTVNKLSAGYIYDFPEWDDLQWGLGGVGSASLIPDSLSPAYGDTPLSLMLFARVKL